MVLPVDNLYQHSLFFDPPTDKAVPGHAVGLYFLNRGTVLGWCDGDGNHYGDQLKKIDVSATKAFALSDRKSVQLVSVGAGDSVVLSIPTYATVPLLSGTEIVIAVEPSSSGSVTLDIGAITLMGPLSAEAGPIALDAGSLTRLIKVSDDLWHLYRYDQGGGKVDVAQTVSGANSDVFGRIVKVSSDGSQFEPVELGSAYAAVVQAADQTFQGNSAYAIQMPDVAAQSGAITLSNTAIQVDVAGVYQISAVIFFQGVVANDRMDTEVLVSMDNGLSDVRIGATRPEYQTSNAGLSYGASGSFIQTLPAGTKISLSVKCESDQGNNYTFTVKQSRLSILRIA